MLETQGLAPTAKGHELNDEAGSRVLLSAQREGNLTTAVYSFVVIAEADEDVAFGLTDVQLKDGENVWTVPDAEWTAVAEG